MLAKKKEKDVIDLMLDQIDFHLWFILLHKIPAANFFS